MAKKAPKPAPNNTASAPAATGVTAPAAADPAAPPPAAPPAVPKPKRTRYVRAKADSAEAAPALPERNLSAAGRLMSKGLTPGPKGKPTGSVKAKGPESSGYGAVADERDRRGPR